MIMVNYCHAVEEFLSLDWTVYPGCYTIIYLYAIAILLGYLEQP